MVLFKRKPITFVPPPLLPSDASPSTSVWIIPETGEWFLNYDDYLNRMSFYNVKKFVCETSGNSNFTFFEALKVEHNELFSMQSNFPEPVKEPILRHVSFSTVPRIDLLVDQVYSKFKDDFFPGDKVIVKYTGGYRAHGIIKEKVVFNSRMDSNGVIQSPFISYRVYLPADEHEVVIEDSSLIYRERNRFTKSYVKTFLKMSLTRTNRLGAPWIIRDEIAKKYKISLEWPSDMKKLINNKNLKSSINRINILNDDESNNDDNRIEKFENVENNENDENNENENFKNNTYNYNSFNKMPIKNQTQFVQISTPDSKVKYRFKQDQKPLNTNEQNDIHLENYNYNNSENSDENDQNIQITFNQNENSLDYGMRSSRGFSHSVFENLKETPPSFENLYEKWCEHWYEILKKTTAYFENNEIQDRAKGKVLKLFKFAGVKIIDKFDSDNTHFIITQRPFNSKEDYPENDPFHYVHLKKIKVWHYEKCQRFFKSIKISNRRIDQIAKKQAIQKSINVLDHLTNNQQNNNYEVNDVYDDDDNSIINNSANVNSSQNGFVNIAPAPISNGKEEILNVKNKSKGKNKGKGKGKGKGKSNKKVIENGNSVENKHINDEENNDDSKKSKSKSKNLKNDDKNNNNGKVSEKTDSKQNTTEQTSEKKSHKPVIVDDLLLPVQTNKPKPTWKKLSNSNEDLDLDNENCLVSISNVLEVWIFINMFHDAFVIDTFTFDDFVYALKWNNPTKPCPLLLEIFCSLLTCIMSKEGELLITLPVDIQAEIKEREAELKEKKSLKEKEKQEKEKKTIKIEDSEIDNDGEDVENEKDLKDNKDNNTESGNEDIKKEIESGSESKSLEILEEIIDEEEEEEINHNAYSILDYKKISWKDRLKKRHFKDGQWLIILLGVFSMTEFIPDYKKTIIQIYELLAPLDEAPTPEKLIVNFYQNVNASRRISILSILMELLLNGESVRNHTDFVVEKSAALRRERFELQKELKSKIEIAHSANKDVLDSLRNIDIKEIKQRIEDLELGALTTDEEREKWLEVKNKGGRPIQNTLPPEPSALEKAVAAGHPEFLNLLNIRTEKILDVENMKKQRMEIDKTLVELNCQRIRYLGRDKVWNRYWWFERNGLPNLGGNKDNDDDENEEGDHDHDRDDNEEDSEIDKKDDNSEYDSETYLMGRLWIQGPSNVDLHHLKGADGDGSGLKRKMIEEGDNILTSEFNWVYIDEIEDLNKLLSWLNDKGIRERALKKELNECKDQVISSFKARNKFLRGGEIQSKLVQYIKDLEDGKFKEEEHVNSDLLEANDKKESQSDDKTEVTETYIIGKNDETDGNNENDESVINDIDNEEVVIEDANDDDDNDDDDENIRITRSTRSMKTRGQSNNKKNIIEEPLRRSKRNAEKEPNGTNTRSKKRRLVNENSESNSDKYEFGENEEISIDDNYDNKISANIGKDFQTEDEKLDEMVNNFELPKRNDDNSSDLREKLLKKAHAKLEKLEDEHREENMVLWVNSAAIEKQGYTHYDGPKIIPPARNSRNKGKGRSSKTVGTGNKNKSKGRRR